MACRAPEVLFESDAEYGGVTGLWSLPARLGDAAHALAVLAFADTSRALAAGALLTHLASFAPGRPCGRCLAVQFRALLLAQPACKRHSQYKYATRGFLSSDKMCWPWGFKPWDNSACPALPAILVRLHEACDLWHAGTSLADATEAVGLAADERTLAAGIAADLVAVQARMLLSACMYGRAHAPPLLVFEPCSL